MANTVDIRTHREPGLEHHIQQGNAWLTRCAEVTDTVALSYAAFELRLATERLAVHYWAALLNRKIQQDDLQDIRSFKRIENRIYELGGHQREINRHFEVSRIMLKALEIEASFITPNVGNLSKYWHECSELCHIGWTLSCSVAEIQNDAFTTLTRISDELLQQARSLGWPVLSHPDFIRLRDQYVAGEASAEDIQSWIEEQGVWARAVYNDGRPTHFVGEAVPPSS